MYSWEIEQFIKERNFRIGGDDLVFLVTPSNNPQVTGIRYDAFNNTYIMTTSDNYCFFFQPIPLKEAEQKGLIKTKKLVKKD